MRKYNYEIKATFDMDGYIITSIEKNPYGFTDEKSAYAAMGKAAAETVNSGHIIKSMRICLE